MNILAFSGMGSSGKTAIIDFLYSNNLITGLFNNYPNESALVNTVNSLISFLHLYKDKKFTSEIIFYILSGGKELLIDLNRLEKANSFIIKDPLSNNLNLGRNINNLNSDFIFFEDFYSIFYSIFEVGSEYEYERVIELGLRFLNDISLSIWSQNKTIVLHNDPHHRSYYISHERKFLSKINNLIHIVTIRNPHDIVYERLNINKYFNENVNDIYKSLFKQYSALLVLLVLKFFNKKFFIISFEDTLSTKGLISFTNKFFNNNIDSINFSNKIFDLNKSLENVNIYKRLRLKKTFFGQVLFFFLYSPLKFIANLKNKFISIKY